MEKQPLISIIIPVYNVEKYLDKCVESVLAQTYKNFEVILVDDGSTDSSGKMCNEYAEKDGRIKAYHKPNGGLSDARNFGVEHCNADLVSFIDSDDYVTEDYLEYLWSLMTQYSCKVSCAGNIQVFEGRSFSLKKDQITEIKLNTEKALKRICYTSVSACARLYQKELLLKHPFPVGRLYEDLATTYKIIAECDYVVFSDKQIYIWAQRKSSISHGRINQKQYDVFWAAKEQLEYIKANYPNAVKAAENRCVMASLTFLDRLFLYETTEAAYYQYARDFAIPYVRDILKNRESSAVIKIKCIAMLLGYRPAKWLWTAKYKLQKRHDSNNLF